MDQTAAAQPKKKEMLRSIFSAILDDGTLVESLYRSAEQRTLFCVSRDGAISYVDDLVKGSERLMPYSPHNPLLANHVVLLPAEPAEYETEEALVAEMQ